MGSRLRGKGLIWVPGFAGKELFLRGWIVPVGGSTPDRRELDFRPAQCAI